jgi:dTDP-N-acetylfucosamine:lipid II N-acetylfucosaminyltransferase
MTALIHVLGSDIPHHNHTVLRFFNEHLAATGIHAREFMLAGQDDGMSDAYPNLHLHFYGSKQALAKGCYCQSAGQQAATFLFPRSIQHRYLAGTVARGD